MKSCSSCEFNTNHEEYNICPICGAKLTEGEEAKLYMVGITKGNPVSSPIRLTRKEALLIKRVSEELSTQFNYHTKLWIEIE